MHTIKYRQPIPLDDFGISTQWKSLPVSSSKYNYSESFHVGMPLPIGECKLYQHNFGHNSIMAEQCRHNRGLVACGFVVCSSASNLY